MPTVEQVSGTLPSAFRFKYPNSYAIIDGSEIFIETSSDLHLQSSTWSQYTHHNTTKFLVRVPQMDLFSMYTLDVTGGILVAITK